MTMHGGPTVKSKRHSWILKFHAVDSGLWIPDSLSVKFGVRISIVSGIPDFLRFILGSKAQDSGLEKETLPVSLFHKQKFPTFRNPHSPTWDEIHNSPEFLIPLCEFRVLDSLLDYWFQSLGFRISRAKISRIPKSTCRDFSECRNDYSFVFKNHLLRPCQRFECLIWWMVWFNTKAIDVLDLLSPIT